MFHKKKIEKKRSRSVDSFVVNTQSECYQKLISYCKENSSLPRFSMFPCSVCSQHFADATSRQVHMMQKHVNLFSACEICHKIFATNSEKQRHLNTTHARITLVEDNKYQIKFVCKVCNVAQFDSVRELISHSPCSQCPPEKSLTQNIKKKKPSSRKRGRKKNKLKKKSQFPENEEFSSHFSNDKEKMCSDREIGVTDSLNSHCGDLTHYSQCRDIIVSQNSQCGDAAESQFSQCGDLTHYSQCRDIIVSQNSQCGDAAESQFSQCGDLTAAVTSIKNTLTADTLQEHLNSTNITEIKQERETDNCLSCQLHINTSDSVLLPDEKYRALKKNICDDNRCDENSVNKEADSNVSPSSKWPSEKEEDNEQTNKTGDENVCLTCQPSQTESSENKNFESFGPGEIYHFTEDGELWTVSRNMDIDDDESTSDEDIAEKSIEISSENVTDYHELSMKVSEPSECVLVKKDACQSEIPSYEEQSGFMLTVSGGLSIAGSDEKSIDGFGKCDVQCTSELPDTDDQSTGHSQNSLSVEEICPVCCQVFHRYLQLKLHIRLCHPDQGHMLIDGDSECSDTKIFPVSLVRSGNCKTGFPCSHCAGTFSDKSSLEAHLLVKHSDYFHPCNLCEKVFIFPGLKRQHYLTAHFTKNNVENEQEEETCSKILAPTTNIKTSLALFNKDDDFRASLPVVFETDVVMETNLQNGNLSDQTKSEVYQSVSRYKDGGKSDFPCKFCDKIFHSLTKLADHAINVHKGMKLSSSSSKRKLFPCKFCEKTFTSLTQMCNHATAVHHEDMPTVSYPCECGKLFTTTTGLVLHLKHSCPLNKEPTRHKCRKSGRNRFTHNIRPKPYMCHFCDHSFVSQVHLQNHTARSHPVTSSEFSVTK